MVEQLAKARFELETTQIVGSESSRSGLKNRCWRPLRAPRSKPLRIRGAAGSGPELAAQDRLGTAGAGRTGEIRLACHHSHPPVRCPVRAGRRRHPGESPIRPAREPGRNGNPTADFAKPPLRPIA